MRYLFSTLALGWLFGMATPALATSVELVALFTGKVVLRIDGKRRVLAEGERSPEGVEVLRANSERAIVRVDGIERRLTLQSGRFGGPYRKQERAVVRLYREPNGHFITAGSINGLPVSLMVDTGATVVAISEQLARRLGIDYQRAEQDHVRTAAGISTAWPVTLNRVRLGDIELEHVEGVVLPGNQPEIPLLGMSFLKRLNTRTEGQVMILETK